MKKVFILGFLVTAILFFFAISAAFRAGKRVGLQLNDPVSTFKVRSKNDSSAEKGTIILEPVTTTKRNSTKKSQDSKSTREDDESSAVDLQGNSRIQSGQWNCCVDPLSVNSLPFHPQPDEVQDITHQYQCPEMPSNFSWFYSSSPSSNQPRTLNRKLWKQKTIVFVGGSTTRQMLEQYRWEMPFASRYSKMVFAHFLFRHIEVGGCCNYNRSHTLDLRMLDPDLISNMTAAPDFVVFNVGLWWSTKTIGYVIDQDGVTWNIGGSKNSEWFVVNKTSSSLGLTPPDVTFATLMRSAIQMMLKVKHPRTTLVWRSESTTDCPPGSSHRGTITPVLKQEKIPILNISEATCNYLLARNNFDKERRGPHLCFPSVCLRHWMLEFQYRFLSSDSQ